MIEHHVAYVNALEATITKMRKALEAYAETFCEHGFSHSGCGHYSAEVCSGCVARAVLASLAVEEAPYINPLDHEQTK